MQRQMDWDYLRYIHALATGGTLARAGDILGVHQTTVLRRLDQMEEQLGVQLFERTRDGVQLTPAGETAFNEADRLSQGMDGLERKLIGQDARPAGEVRLATTDTLPSCLINPILSEFVALIRTVGRRRYRSLVADPPGFTSDGAGENGAGISVA